MKRPAVILCVAGGVVLLAFFALRTHDEDDKQVQADGPGLAQPPSLGLSNGLPDTDQGSITTGAPSRRPRSLLGSGAGPTTTPPSQEAIRTESKTHDVSGTSAGETPPLPTVIASTLQTECRKVAEDLAGEESRPREDLLAMYGRSSAASGRFDLAAAAYAMFLEEFGTQHPYSERIAVRLADCLAPLDLDNIEIAFAESGPKYIPSWKMGHQPRTERLRQSVAVYELVAELASGDYDKGQALLRLGWVHRALDNWAASTAAWDRCAASLPDSPVAVQASWLAAENIAWTDQPKAAAERWRRLASGCPNEAGSRAALDRAELLEAESLRTADWLTDPVASLIAEIGQLADHCALWEAYGGVASWLQRQGYG